MFWSLHRVMQFPTWRHGVRKRRPVERSVAGKLDQPTNRGRGRGHRNNINNGSKSSTSHSSSRSGGQQRYSPVSSKRQSQLLFAGLFLEEEPRLRHMYFCGRDSSISENRLNRISQTRSVRVESKSERSSSTPPCTSPR